LFRNRTIIQHFFRIFGGKIVEYMENGENFTAISVKQGKELMPKASWIEDKLILFDKFSDVPLTTDKMRMTCLFVGLCTSGRVSYSVDTKKVTIQRNDIIILNNNQVVSDYMMSKDGDGIGIMCSQPFFLDVVKGVRELTSLFLFSRNNPVFTLPEDVAQTMFSYFKLVKSKVDNLDHHFRERLATTLLKAMIYDIGNEIWRVQQEQMERVTNRTDWIFSQFLQLVEQNFAHERRVGWYAKKLEVSPKYLLQAVKYVSQRTPNEWIDDYVTTEACVKLKNTSKSMKEIANDLHFSSQSFFGKFFKDHIGMSPIEYRNSK